MGIESKLEKISLGILCFLSVFFWISSLLEGDVQVKKVFIDQEPCRKVLSSSFHPKMRKKGLLAGVDAGTEWETSLYRSSPGASRPVGSGLSKLSKNLKGVRDKRKEGGDKKEFK